MVATASLSQVPVLASAPAEILIERFDFHEPDGVVISWTGPCRDRSHIDRSEGVSRLASRESHRDWRAGRWGTYAWRRDCLRYDEERTTIGIAFGANGSQ